MSDSVIQSKEEHMETTQEPCADVGPMKIDSGLNTSDYQDSESPNPGDGDGDNDSDNGPSKEDTNATEPSRIEVNPSRSNEQPTDSLKEEAKFRHEMAEEESDCVSSVKLAVGNGTREVSTKKPSILAVSDSGFGMLRPHTKSLEKLTNMSGSEFSQEIEGEPDVEEEHQKPEMSVVPYLDLKTPAKTSIQDVNNALAANDPGTEEEQADFMKELEIFYKERHMDFKPPKFYGEPLNLLKLWRAVVKLGGYEQVTSCKLWRQIGESFRPPKTCTTVSWTFRGFYEKAVLEYEKHKMRCGELPFGDASFGDPSSVGNQGLGPASGSGRARRDAAARAMQGWHSQRLLDNGEDKSSMQPKREKPIKGVGLLKRKTLSPVDHTLELARIKTPKPQVETVVADIGQPADWVKINVQRTKDCFEIYALVPGLLREEVRVQSDPAGRLVISGQPEQVDNHWGVTPFKKVVTLPSRIDPHQTSAVVTLHGQLFVRVPFEQSDL